MKTNCYKLINEMISNSMLKMEDVTTDICKRKHYSNISTHIVLPDDFEKEDGMQIFINNNKDEEICQLFNYEIIDVTNNRNDKNIKMLVVDEMFIGQNLVIYYITKTEGKCCTINNDATKGVWCVDIDSNSIVTWKRQ